MERENNIAEDKHYLAPIQNAFLLQLSIICLLELVILSSAFAKAIDITGVLKTK